MSDIVQAVSKGDIRLCRLLIRKGHIEDTDGDGNTPLIIAAKRNHIKIVKLLVERRAKLNHQNNMLDTALHVAAVQGIMNVSIIRILLEAGANASLPNKNNRTALGIICKSMQLTRHPKLAPLIKKYKQMKSKKKAAFVSSTMKDASLKQLQARVHGGRGDSAEDSAVDSFRHVFEVLTAANSGTLLMKNLEGLFKFLNICMYPADMEALHDLLDINQDKKVDFDDFYVAMMWPELTDEEEVLAIDKPFDALDAGWNRPSTGVITRADYRIAEKELGAMFCADSDKEVTKIFSQVMPDYAAQVKLDASIGLDKRVFSRLIGGKMHLQYLDKKARTVL